MDKEKEIEAEKEIEELKDWCEHYDAFRVRYESIELVLEYIDFLKGNVKQAVKEFKERCKKKAGLYGITANEIDELFKELYGEGNN